MLLDLGLKFFGEAAAHPLAAFGLDLQLHVAQPSASACFRVHLLTFRSGCLHSEEEPIFPATIMAQVSSYALRVRAVAAAFRLSCEKALAYSRRPVEACA